MNGRAAATTLALIALVWLVWQGAARLAARAGFEDLELLIQIAAVFAVLTAAERAAARLRGH